MLGLAPENTSGESTTHVENTTNRHCNEQSTLPGDLISYDLPQSVMQIVAKALQCDLLIAGVLTKNSTRLAETVLCVPKGRITVPVRLSKGLIAAAASCEVPCFPFPVLYIINFFVRIHAACIYGANPIH